MSRIRLFRWSRYLALAVVLVVSLVRLISVSNVPAAGSSATNDLIGDLVVFSQDYTNISAVPGNMCVAMDTMSGDTSSLTLRYNGTSHCVSFDATAGAVGKLFVGGLSPSLSTTITLDMGMGRTEESATINVFAGGAWLAIKLLEGTPTDTLRITSKYYTYRNPTLYSATSDTPDMGFSDSGRFRITIVSNTVSRNNTIYLNDVEKLTTPYTRYRAANMTTVHDPFVNPFIHFSFASISSGRSAYLQLYSIEQTVPEYSYVTPISNPKVISFGVDGPDLWSADDDGLSLLDGGTIWADVTSLDGYSVSDLAALKALIADGFELGIHFSQRLSDLSLADAIALMNGETAEITTIFGQPPTSWCSLQGADNVAHAEYAYTNLGMVSRNGVNGSAGGLSSIGNLADNCWTFWSSASAAGIVIPSFSHQLDVTPAIDWSISATNFQTFVSDYASNGVQIIGFREYWEKAQNSYHTNISNIVSDPGVSLSFTVDNMGGRSRLLVNAPWANVVQGSSGDTVPFAVYGSGIVIEVGGGNYTVAAAPTCGTMSVNPATWSSTVTCGRTSTQTVTVSATTNLIQGVSVAKTSGPTWLTVSPASLGTISPGTPQTFTMTTSPPSGTSGTFTYVVTVSDSCGTPSSIDVTGTITVSCAALMEGDVNLNGHVTVSDALMIAQYKAGMINLTADQLACADTTDDGNVTMADAMHIAQWLVDPTGSLGVLHQPLWQSPADDSMLPPVA